MRLNVGKILLVVFTGTALFISFLIVRDYLFLNKLFSENNLIKTDVINKTMESKTNYSIRVHFVYQGQTKELKIKEYLSEKEYQATEEGKQVVVYYMPSKEKAYLQSSMQRWSQDVHWLWAFAGLLFLLGIIGRIAMRKYWGRYDETGEYLEKEDGTIVAADRGYKMRNMSNSMKFFSWFFTK